MNKRVQNFLDRVMGVLSGHRSMRTSNANYETVAFNISQLTERIRYSGIVRNEIYNYQFIHQWLTGELMKISVEYQFHELREAKITCCNATEEEKTKLLLSLERLGRTVDMTFKEESNI